MIDLHTHTTESDGTTAPAALIEAAVNGRLDAIAITDHDTFAGYDLAVPHAARRGMPLYRGIELSTALGKPKERTVHLLAYFFRNEPTAAFTAWVLHMQESRRDRNVRLAAKLQSMGMDVRIEEVNDLGRSMAGRPHFARLMVDKGYCTSLRDAFDRYLDESAQAYVEREEPTVEEAIRRVNEAGGLSCIAHPVRLGKRHHHEEERLIAHLCDCGLQAIEAYHPDHTAGDMHRYLSLAGKYGLKVTGGSDYHGGNKPGIRLGTGAGDLAISKSVLEDLLR